MTLKEFRKYYIIENNQLTEIEYQMSILLESRSPRYNSGHK